MRRFGALVLAVAAAGALAVSAAPAAHARYEAAAWRFGAPRGVVVSQVTGRGYRISWAPVRGPGGQRPASYTVATWHGATLADRFTTRKTSAAEYGRRGRGLAAEGYTTQVWANGGPAAPRGAVTRAVLYRRAVSGGENGGLGPFDEPGEVPASDGNNSIGAITGTWGCGQIAPKPTPDACGPWVLAGDSPSDWQVSAWQLGDHGRVLAYPDMQMVFTGSNGNDPLVRSFRRITATFAITNPPLGDYEAAADMWLDPAKGQADEIMVWEFNHGQTPSGNPAGFATIAGVRYQVLYDPGATVNFVRVRNVTHGTIHVLAMLNWLIAHGYETRRVVRLSEFNFGWEICSTGNRWETFRVRDYTLLTSPATGNED